MFTIQPGCFHSSDEKLRRIRIWASVGHRNDSSAVRNGKALIGKSASINGVASLSVVSGKIAALDHEILDHSVELGS